MRCPVFPKHSNPSIDPPNQRKSLAYCAAVVLAGYADWIDPKDPSAGILCRSLFAPERDHEKVIAGSGFDTAWGVKDSGHTGMLVWQMKSQKNLAHA